MCRVGYFFSPERLSAKRLHGNPLPEFSLEKGSFLVQRHQADWQSVDPAAFGPAFCVRTESAFSWACPCLMCCAIWFDLASMQHLRVRFQPEHWVIPFSLLYSVT